MIEFLKNLSPSKEVKEREEIQGFPLSQAWFCPNCEFIFSRRQPICPSCTSEHAIRLQTLTNREKKEETIEEQESRHREELRKLRSEFHTSFFETYIGDSDEDIH